MNILKQIKLLVLVLAPTCLVGMEQSSWTIQDKKGNKVLIEGYGISDANELLKFNEQLISVSAEAFADETIDVKSLLLDDSLQMKSEYAKTVEGLSKSERTELDDKIASSSHDRSWRVEHTRQMLLKGIEKTKSELSAATQEDSTVKSFVTIAKSDSGKILGHAIFSVNPGDDGYVWIDQLAVLPSAQGRGLARHLVFSILKLNPKTSNIGLNTELWNINRTLP